MAEIALTNGGVTLVDDEDVPYLSTYRWAGYTMRSNLRYAMADELGIRYYMHRLVMNAPDGLEVDHINGDTLDNRKKNLRIVTHQQNQQNRRNGYGITGYRNVYVNASGRYHVKLVVNGRGRSFGAYDTIEEAAYVARNARLEHMPFSDESATEIPPPPIEWRPSERVPGVFVAPDGRIRNSRGQVISPFVRTGGKHPLISVTVNGKQRQLSVGKLFAEVWPELAG